VREGGGPAAGGEPVDRGVHDRSGHVGGLVKTVCRWKDGPKEVWVEAGATSNWAFLQKDPSAHWQPYEGVGYEALVDDTSRKDGKHVVVKLTKGTVEVSLRPNPVDPALLKDLVLDVIGHAPAA
jgi:hypothetical protein